MVLDQTLANSGAYGVKKLCMMKTENVIIEGKKSKTEFGILINLYLEREIFNNIVLKNRLTLY